MNIKTNRISFQGDFGANSDMACRDMFPTMEPLALPDISRTPSMAVENGDADLAMIPIENTIAGRVADIHHLLPESRLHIIGEYFMPIRFQLMVLPGVLEATKSAPYTAISTRSASAARSCAQMAGSRSIAGDTAGAAEARGMETGDRTMAALAPRLAADLYSLDIVAENVEDTESNVTRFVVLSRDEEWVQAARSEDEVIVTTFVFNVRNIPAALYKALGGFATNGINMTKLESYQLGGKFVATQFYADIEGHPDDAHVRRALEELRFFSENVRILGTYRGHPMRGQLHK